MPLLDHEIAKFKPLMTRVDPKQIAAMLEASKEDLAAEDSKKTKPHETSTEGHLVKDPIADPIDYGDFAKVDLRIARIAAGVIWVAALLASPLIGNQCRFFPTCSHYAEDALKCYGAWKGSIMAAKRLLRCHPWHEGGFDPVP